VTSNESNNEEKEMTEDELDIQLKAAGLRKCGEEDSPVQNVR
jgi:hypothetical protein